MSRTTQKEIQDNPCTKFLQWKTLKKTVIVDEEEVETIKGGSFVYYDKDTKTNIPIKLPLKFAILNMDLACFKGYDESRKRGVWSNEVNKPEQEVVIRCKEEKLLSFKRSEYKINGDKIKSLGAKFTNSVYIAVLNEKEWEIWNLQLSGASLTGSPEDFNKLTEDEKKDGWFSFTKHNKSKLYSNFVEVASFKAKKKGTNKFVIPVYTLGEEIDDSTAEILNELDVKFNDFLAYYFNKPLAEVIADKTSKEEEEKEEEEVEDKLPF